MPDSVFELTDPRWKGKIGIAPTNASFQAFVTAMRLDAGEERTRQWLEDLMENDPKFYEKNTPVVEAVASGEIEVGLVNHYYLYLVKQEQPDAPIENKYLPGDDPGALVSVAGAGVLASAKHPDAAERFVEFLLADPQQRFYTEEAEEAEIPLVDGIEPKEGVPTLDELASRGPDVDLSSFGAELERDARAPERDRLHVVIRGRAGRGRAPLSLLLPACVTVALLLLPLAYLVARASSGGGRGWRVLTRSNTLELIWSTWPARGRRHARLGHDRRLGRVADDAHRPARPAALGGRRRAAARDPELRRRLLPARRVRAPRAAAAVARGRAAAGDLRLLGRARGADPLHLPLRAAARLGGAARARPGARGGGPRARADAGRRLPPRDAACAAAVDRCRGAARRALHALGLRRRLADALRRAHPRDLPPVQVALRPDAGRGARARAGGADGARALAREPLAAAGLAERAGERRGRPARTGSAAGAGPRSPTAAPSSAPSSPSGHGARLLARARARPGRAAVARGGELDLRVGARRPRRGDRGAPDRPARDPLPEPADAP